MLSGVVLVFKLALSAQTIHRHGTLASVDTSAHSLILHPASGRHVSYQWDASTMCLDDETPVRPESLRVGVSLGLGYRRGGPPHVLTKVYLIGGPGNP